VSSVNLSFAFQDDLFAPAALYVNTSQRMVVSYNGKKGATGGGNVLHSVAHVNEIFQG
jgi:hypothetical protein